MVKASLSETFTARGETRAHAKRGARGRGPIPWTMLHHERGYPTARGHQGPKHASLHHHSYAFRSFGVVKRSCLRWTRASSTVDPPARRPAMTPSTMITALPATACQQVSGISKNQEISIFVLKNFFLRRKKNADAANGALPEHGPDRVVG